MTEDSSGEPSVPATIHEQILDRLFKIQNQIDRIEGRVAPFESEVKKPLTLKDYAILFAVAIVAAAYVYFKYF